MNNKIDKEPFVFNDKFNIWYNVTEHDFRRGGGVEKIVTISESERLIESEFTSSFSLNEYNFNDGISNSIKIINRLKLRYGRSNSSN